MAGNGKRGGGDRILESRHLVGLFLGVVLMCAVFFTLGYVMGRTQFSGSVHAAESPMPPATAEASEAKPKAEARESQPSAPAVGEWDFYGKKSEDHLEAPVPSEDSSSAKDSS